MFLNGVACHTFKVPLKLGIKLAKCERDWQKIILTAIDKSVENFEIGLSGENPKHFFCLDFS